MKMYLEKATGVQIPVYLLGLMVSLYVLVSIILDTFKLGALSNADALKLLGYCLSVIVVQSIITVAMYKYCKRIVIAHMVVSLFTTANIFFFSFSLKGLFLVLDLFVQAFILAGIFGVLLLTIWKGHRLVVTLATMALIPIIVFKVSTAIIYATDDNSYPLPIDYQFKQFKQKPNIYLLSYDGLVPEDIATLHIPDVKLWHIDRLKALGAEVTPDVYANDNTLATLNSMLAMNISWWNSFPLRNRHRLLSGVQSNPVYDLLLGNGYNISLLYKNDYLTRGEASPAVNYYYHHNSLCDLGLIRRAAAFWGYCDFFAGSKSITHTESLFYLIEKLYHVVTEDYQNKFVLAYFPIPGHTSSVYSWYNKASVDAFQKTIIDNIPAALYFMERAIAIVRDHDPNAIIMLFGDHGAYFARGRRVEDGFTEEDRVDDTNKVLLATFNMPECAIQERLDGKLFIQKVVANLMHCLADEDGLAGGGESDGESSGSVGE